MNFDLNFVINDHTKYEKYLSLLEKAIEIGFEEFHKKINNKTISIVLIDSKEIQRLNNEYRDTNKPTDVLSFEGIEDEIGDILINVDFVEKQAKEFNHSVEREFIFLFIHSLLHLLGYDHQNDKEEEKMIEMQNKIMKLIGINR